MSVREHETDPKILLKSLCRPAPYAKCQPRGSIFVAGRILAAGTRRLPFLGAGVTSSYVPLVLLGELRNLKVEVLDSATSPLTGKPLRRLRLDVGARGETEHERLVAELESAANGTTLIAGADGEEWRVTNHYSYQDDRLPSVFEYTVDLEEQEQVTLDRAEFRGLAVVPDRWSAASAPEGATTVQLLVDMDAEHNGKFERALEEYFKDSEGSLYFPVTLAGVSDDPRSMRFGRCIWEPADDGHVRHMIVLVSEQGDGNRPNFLLGEPQTHRLKERSMTTETALRALIGELEQ
jgi:hypothetical protein